MSTTQIVALLVALAIIVAVALAAVVVMRRRALRQRFGPEYDRVVADSQNRSAAEAELRERERRHAQLTLNELSPQARAQYATEWAAVQARFVEQPAGTVADADALITRLVRERGYPTSDYDEALAHLSVEHGHTLGHYREAHDIYLANERGEATTEQLRQALMHYRSIFADVLGEEPVPATDTVEATRTDEVADTVEPSGTPDASYTDTPDATDTPDTADPTATSGTRRR